MIVALPGLFSYLFFIPVHSTGARADNSGGGGGAKFLS